MKKPSNTATSLRVIGAVVLLLFTTLLGYSLGRSWLSSNMALPIFLLTLLLFIATRQFIDIGGWGGILSPAFAFTAGLSMSIFFPASDMGRWFLPGAITLGGLILSYWISKLISLRITGIHPILRSLTWIYLLGWAIILLLHLPHHISKGWAALGGLLFFGLAVEWFSFYPRRSTVTLASALAFEMYVIGLNLALASGILLA